MAVQWTTNKLKTWTRQVRESGITPLLRLHERFNDLHDSTKALIGNEIATRALTLGRTLIKAELREVSLKDGPMSYWKTHTNHPETILFIHGFGDSKDGCYPFAMHLTRHFNMMAFDLPGFGASFKNSHLDYNFESYAHWMDEFMVAIESGPVHLIGNSLGGAMAMKLAEIRPDLVKTLTLIDTAAVIDDRFPSAYDDFIQGRVLFQIKTREEFDRFWKLLFHKPPFLPIFMKDHLYEQFRSNYDLYGRFILNTFRGIKSRTDPALLDLFMNKPLTKMKMPIHIIWGDQDKLFPLSYGKHAHELVKGSRFTVLKNIGHAPQVEAPHTTAKHVKRFIDEQCTILAKKEAVEARMAEVKTELLKKVASTKKAMKAEVQGKVKTGTKKAKTSKAKKKPATNAAKKIGKKAKTSKPLSTKKIPKKVKTKLSK